MDVPTPEQILGALGARRAKTYAQELMRVANERLRAVDSDSEANRALMRRAALAVGDPSIALVRDGRVYVRVWALLAAWPLPGPPPARSVARLLPSGGRRSIRVGDRSRIYRDLGAA